MKKLFITTLSILLFSATAAFAMDLATAKNQGLVGERTDGYIGAVNNTPQAQALVSDINQRRKQAYQAISKENGQQLSVVETLAAKKLYNKLAAGEYYQAADGSWKRK